MMQPLAEQVDVLQQRMQNPSAGRRLADPDPGGKKTECVEYSLD
jgi:hypothetical protein